MDIRAAQARQHHRDAVAAAGRATQYRQQRDRLIRSLREEDPGYWTYPRLAGVIGCSPELIAYIVRAG